MVGMSSRRLYRIGILQLGMCKVLIMYKSQSVRQSVLEQNRHLSFRGIARSLVKKGASVRVYLVAHYRDAMHLTDAKVRGVTRVPMYRIGTL